MSGRVGPRITRPLPHFQPVGGGPASGKLSGFQGGVSEGHCCPRVAIQTSKLQYFLHPIRDQGDGLYRELPTLLSRNHCSKCNVTLSRALETFCDLQSPATIALKVPSFLRWEFPDVLLRAHSWKCCRVLSLKLTSHSYCIVVDPNLRCYLPDPVSPSL